MRIVTKPSAAHPALGILVAVGLGACGGGEPAGGAAASAEMAIPPDFRPAQPELFAAPGAQPNAWADYDRDGDLDLFVGFRGAANRLYRNDAAVFT